MYKYITPDQYVYTCNGHQYSLANQLLNTDKYPAHGDFRYIPRYWSGHNGVFCYFVPITLKTIQGQLTSVKSQKPVNPMCTYRIYVLWPAVSMKINIKVLSIVWVIFQFPAKQPLDIWRDKNDYNWPFVNCIYLSRLFCNSSLK